MKILRSVEVRRSHGNRRLDKAPVSDPRKASGRTDNGVQSEASYGMEALGSAKSRGSLDSHFTSGGAWEFIATKLEEGHSVEVVELQKPPGKKGYVMKIDLDPGDQPLYVKLQLGSGKVIGRSFHYSIHPRAR